MKKYTPPEVLTMDLDQIENKDERYRVGESLKFLKEMTDRIRPLDEHERLFVFELAGFLHTSNWGPLGYDYCAQLLSDYLHTLKALPGNGRGIGLTVSMALNLFRDPEQTLRHGTMGAALEQISRILHPIPAV